jgi:hypothetical protein
MQELEATWGRATRVWWLIMWRGVLGGTLIGGAVGVIVGIVTVVVVLVVHGSLDRVEEQPIYQIGIALGALLGVIIGIGWYIVVVRMALRKQYRDFRLVIVPRSAS